MGLRCRWTADSRSRANCGEIHCVRRQDSQVRRAGWRGAGTRAKHRLPLRSAARARGCMRAHSTLGRVTTRNAVRGRAAGLGWQPVCEDWRSSQAGLLWRREAMCLSAGRGPEWAERVDKRFGSKRAWLGCQGGGECRPGVREQGGSYLVDRRERLRSLTRAIRVDQNVSLCVSRRPDGYSRSGRDASCGLAVVAPAGAGSAWTRAARPYLPSSTRWKSLHGTPVAGGWCSALCDLLTSPRAGRSQPARLRGYFCRSVGRACGRTCVAERMATAMRVSQPDGYAWN